MTGTEASPAMVYDAITVTPLGGACGAQIDNIDLSDELDEQVITEIIRALDEHCVVRFRDQDLSPLSQERFCARFGTLAVYPFVEASPDSQHVIPIVKTPDQTRNFGGGWHSDGVYYDTPPSYTMLYALETPVAGGETLFANQRLATADLTPSFLDTLSTLRVLYKAGNIARRDRSEADMTHHSDAEAAEHQVAHPLVRSHPNTGERLVYLSRFHTRRFAGMSRAESRPLLDQLHDAQTRGEYTTWMDWEPGQLTMWDNRLVLHSALNNYPGQTRRMQRTTVLGEPPIPG